MYEHLLASVNFLYGFRGLHGLIKIWGGDWNDCMNLAGLSGCGVSVWLSIAFYRAVSFPRFPVGTAVSTPAYTAFDGGIGSMTRKAPGVQENGVYLHAMCWKLAADALLGRRDRVAWDVNRILPFRNPVVAGRAEPYVLCNSYMGKETGYRYGTPGQSWRTASSQWFLKAMVNYVFGFAPTMAGMALRPCMPENLGGSCVTKMFRGCTYRVLYRHTGYDRIKA